MGSSGVPGVRRALRRSAAAADEILTGRGQLRPLVKMQGRVFVAQRRAAAALCLALLLLAQQVRAGPLVRSGPDRDPGVDRVQVQRRTARMTPLWRIMNSKPFGAYCQNNYECSTGLCRAGHCSISQRPPFQIANY